MMRNNFVRVLWVVSLMLSSSFLELGAQTAITVPYSFGFEEDETQELSNWVLNPGAKASQCKDQWMVGTAAQKEGERSLYISQDGGENCSFGVEPNVQYAYRDFVLPMGYYVISFDWRCMGTENTGFYAGVYYASSLDILSNFPMEANPNKTSIDNSLIKWSELKNERFSSRWKNQLIEYVGASSTRIYSNGKKPMRLYFVWVNGNQDTAMTTVGPCVDNICINSAECAVPADLTATALTCDTLELTWTGVSETYELEFRSQYDKHWNKRSNIKGERVELSDLAEGMYDFRIRGICNDTMVSAYAYLNDYVVFCPERHCINFVDLNAPTTTCYYGTYTGDSITQAAYSGQGVIDFGGEEKSSRHTVNWDINALDPMTDNMLPKVPQGELASVRLGNWDIYREAEAIVYDYVVDEDASILLLKYAVVLQDPLHETEATKPRFRIEILDEKGRKIDPTCGEIDFIVGEKMDGNGWHKSNYKPINGDGNVWYKDWSTIGLNLTDYVGHPIKIRITTTDCSLGAHFGYAYFTLDCAGAKIYSSSCGDESTVSITAPSGFLYQWFDAKGNPVPDERGGRSLSLQLESSDTTTYTCRLTSTENPDCYFELSTANISRYPFAEFSYDYAPKDCKNIVKFNNTSHIYVGQYDFGEHLYDEECEEFEWRFSNGEVSYEKNPVVTFSSEGGEVSATLFSFIANKACVHDTTITFTLPKIGDTENIADTSICDGSILQVGDERSDRVYMVGVDGTYHVTWQSVAGCDSVWVYNLKVLLPDTVYFPHDTTICADQKLVLDGVTYMSDSSGVFVRRLKNRYGCDSLHMTNVVVLPPISPVVTMKDIEGNKQNSGEIHVSGSGFDYYTLNSERHEASDGDIIGLNGGDFLLVFYNAAGCTMDTLLSMNYPCFNLIFSRWNDVLSVYNLNQQRILNPNVAISDYSSFQWLKNGNEIIGATLSYYYEEGGLDEASYYQVKAVNVNGEIIVSCPYYPTENVNWSASSSAQKFIRNNNLVILVNDVLYDAQGEKINNIR